MINGDEGSWRREGTVWRLAYHGRQQESRSLGGAMGSGPCGLGQVLGQL